MRPARREREIGLFYGIITGLNGGLGIEIFVLLNYAIQLAGSAVPLSLLLCGVISTLTMLSYCELGAAIPEVGGDYTFSKAAFGGFLAFFTGWFRWVSSIFGAALAAMGFAQMVTYFVPINTHLVAALIVVLFTFTSIRGIREIDVITVSSFIAIFTLFIFTGLWHGLKPGPLYPLRLVELPGFLAASIFSFTMFSGVRSVVAISAQVKEPGKNIPRIILLTEAVLIVLYCSIAYVVVGLVPPEEITATTLPLTLAAERVWGGAGGALLTVAGMIAAILSLTTSIMVQSSILQGLSRDGYLPKTLLSMHRRFKTPYVANLLGSAFILFLVATGVIRVIGYVSGFTTLLCFILVNLSLIKLRREKPLLRRPFRTPLYPLTPILGIALSLVLIASAEPYAIALGLAFIPLAVLTYYLKMVGYQRIRVSVGGMSLAVGGGLAAVSILLLRQGAPPILSPWLRSTLPHVLALAAAVYILAGVLNASAGWRASKLLRGLTNHHRDAKG